MNSVFSPLSFLPLKPSLHGVPQYLHLQPLYPSGFCHYSKISHQFSRSNQIPLISLHPSVTMQSLVSAAIPSSEGTISTVHFEDFVEKDWSVIDFDETNSAEEYLQKIDRIISAGKIVETSKVLVSIGSEGFVDRVVDSSPCQQLLVVHDSLFILACIKEKYDKVKCWQGGLINVPDKWTPFDVVFLYFLPALPFELHQVLGSLAKHCSPGARVVISHPQGRQVVEEQREQYPDIVVSNLPEKMTLQSTATDHSFEMIEFVDEPGFYLAVLEFNANNLV